MQSSESDILERERERVKNIKKSGVYRGSTVGLQNEFPLTDLTM
jgi:hypothetical protein